MQSHSYRRTGILISVVAVISAGAWMAGKLLDHQRTTMGAERSQSQTVRDKTSAREASSVDYAMQIRALIPNDDSEVNEIPEMEPLFLHWLKQDPAAAFSFVRSNTGRWNHEIAQQFFAAWIQLDPKAAIAAWHSLSMTDDYSIITSSVAQIAIAVARENPTDFTDLVMLWQNKLGDAMEEGFAIYAEKDPATAVDGLAVVPELIGEGGILNQHWNPGFVRAVAGIAEGWAKRDRQAASAWVKEMETKHPRLKQFLPAY